MLESSDCDLSLSLAGRRLTLSVKHLSAVSRIAYLWTVIRKLIGSVVRTQPIELSLTCYYLLIVQL